MGFLKERKIWKKYLDYWSYDAGLARRCSGCGLVVERHTIHMPGCPYEQYYIQTLQPCPYGESS